MRSISASEPARGFSQTTFLPAANAASVCVTCSAGGYSGNMMGASSTFSVTATDVAGNVGAGSVVVKELACE